VKPGSDLLISWWAMTAARRPSRFRRRPSNGDAEQAELSALFEEVPVERARAVMLVSLRLDGLAREVAHGFAQR